ncbi:MAG: hypothetical protein KDD69_18420, partial [Bdellovibrionales bacterium]|nr:hypothetical protein [Bdellovibrionales bacterium]
LPQLVARWENRRAIVPIVASHFRNDNGEATAAYLLSSRLAAMRRGDLVWSVRTDERGEEGRRPERASASFQLLTDITAVVT